MYWGWVVVTLTSKNLPIIYKYSGKTIKQLMMKLYNGYLNSKDTLPYYFVYTLISRVKI